MLTVLVVDDEPSLRALLEMALEREGYRVLLAENGREALHLLNQADLVVLDISMPVMGGLETLETLREDWPELPVLILTAHDFEEDRVRGLHLGADDYMGKPPKTRELLARVAALLRRTKRQKRLQIGALEFDTHNEKAYRDGLPLELSPKEFRLLLTLARHAGQTLPRSTLFAQVWGLDPEVDERIVDSYIARLRKKIGDNPKNPRFLETDFGRGYYLKAS
ncbi:MAG: response regulator transcription factor [Meiothermus sp.]|nr:response regulator transcription factor [Meiothermus sp.]